MSKLKALEDVNFNVAQMVQFFFEKAENIVGKGQNAGYQHSFFFFFAIFLKAFSSRVVENQEIFDLGKGLEKELGCKESELYKFFLFKGR